MASVLLVENDPSHRLIARSVLGHLGIEPDTAPNGQEGVRRAASQAYDAVLMDIQMPMMDGIEAMKAIRSLLPTERCPRIIAVTARAVPGTRERMLEAGFDAFLHKPLTKAALAEALASPAAASPALAFVARPMTDARHADESHAARLLIDQVHAHVLDLIGEEDEEFVVDLIETFAECSREATAEARDGRQSQDPSAVAAAAHKLRGSASNVGLADLTGLWSEVEEAARRGEPAAFGADLDRALSETDRATALLAGAVQA